MPKRIIRSKKRVLKNRKRSQRKSIKRRKLKTIKGGAFFKKLWAKGRTVGTERTQRGQAFNDKQKTLNDIKTKKNNIRSTLKDFLKFDITGAEIDLRNLHNLYSSAPPNNKLPQGINDSITKLVGTKTDQTWSKEGGLLREIKNLQKMFEGEINKYNEQIANIKGPTLLKQDLKSAVDAITAAAGPMIDGKIAQGETLGEALDNSSNNLNSNESWYFAARALKHASSDYLINKDNKFSIKNLFDNYFLKNKHLTKGAGEQILTKYRDDLIKELSDAKENVGPGFGVSSATSGFTPKLLRVEPAAAPTAVEELFDVVAPQAAAAPAAAAAEEGLFGEVAPAASPTAALTDTVQPVVTFDQPIAQARNNQPGNFSVGEFPPLAERDISAPAQDANV